MILVVLSVLFGAGVCLVLLCLGVLLLGDDKYVPALLCLAVALAVGSVCLGAAEYQRMVIQARLTAEAVTVVKAYKIDENGNTVCPVCARPVDSKEHEDEE